MVLPLVLYRCERTSLTLREEFKERVFENRVLRRIFGHKVEEVVGGWRKMLNEELHNLIKSRKIRWAGHATCMKEMRNVYNILGGKHEGKKDDLGDHGIDERIILE
jgi:hypothetical protein